MPLEISEIAVSIAVGDASTGAAKPPPAVSGCGDGAALSPDQAETLVHACVAEVLRILREREAR